METKTRELDEKETDGEKRGAGGGVKNIKENVGVSGRGRHLFTQVW